MKIYLPNDADGNVIPSNVKVMYEKDGTVVRVDERNRYDGKEWPETFWDEYSFSWVVPISVLMDVVE